MVRDDPSTIIARGLGLAGALALLSACGTSESGDGEDTSVAATETGFETETGSETGDERLPCTVENFGERCDVANCSIYELICLPMPDTGVCPPCDDVCAYELATNKVDYLHTVMCSEVVDGQCCHLIRSDDTGVPAGRPLRDGSTPLLPDVVLGCSSGSAAGDAYREFARAERASVEAFLHCAAVLDELGAPVELVEQNREAAREEARHARLALQAAEALDGVRASLTETPSPAQALDLHAFVRHLVLDGCLGEAGATREACWALEQPEVAARPALARFWRVVAREEAGHAALAWATLEFLLGRVPVLAATADAALRAGLAPKRWDSGVADPRALERFGIASPGTRARVFSEALDTLIRASATLAGHNGSLSS